MRTLRSDETAAIWEVPTASGMRTVQLAIIPSGIDGIAFVQLDDLTDLLDASAHADDLALASEALRAIATRMAHDVSGPLTAMTGFADLLLQQDSGLHPDERAGLLERISAGTRALAEMTASVLSEADPGDTRPEDRSRVPADLFASIQVFVLDISTRQIVRANLAACELIGLDEADIVGRPGSDFVDQEAVVESLRRRVLDEPDTHAGLRVELTAPAGPISALAWIAAVEGTALAVAQVLVVDGDTGLVV